jgi:hypothetical protein
MKFKSILFFLPLLLTALTACESFFDPAPIATSEPIRVVTRTPAPTVIRSPVPTLASDLICKGIEECSSVGDRYRALLFRDGWLVPGVKAKGYTPLRAHQDKPLAKYMVTGDTLGAPVLEPTSDRKLKLFQDDTASQQKMWANWAAMFPPAQRALIREFNIFTDGVDDLLAFVEPNANDPSQWNLWLDIQDAKDSTELLFTFVHEFGHLVTLNASQVPPDLDVILSDDVRVVEQAAARCATYFPHEGCSLENSYINLFYEKFWRGTEREWRRRTNAGRDVQGIFDYYSANASWFVTDYAAKNPNEDIAEAWTAFVLQPKPSGKTIADQKILFFYRFPELVQLRAQILARTYTQFRR